MFAASSRGHGSDIAGTRTMMPQDKAQRATTPELGTPPTYHMYIPYASHRLYHRFRFG